MRLTYAGRSAELDPISFFFRPILNEDRDLTNNFNLPSVFQKSIEKKISERNKNTLERLVINVANMCNLDCVYCYAQGGDYGGPQEKMSSENGKRTFDKFFKMYDEIDLIQFFGGEPLINWPLISQLCKYGWKLADSKSKNRPVFSLITNGTILNSDIINMIKEYDIKVTVSLDGPPQINEKLRITRQKITKNTISNNIKQLKKETEQPTQVEGTYTHTHVEEKCTVVDVMDYLFNEFGVGLLHMPINVLSSGIKNDPYSLKKEDFETVQKSYADAVSKTIYSLTNNTVDKVSALSSALDIVTTLLNPNKKESKYICPAGNGTIAVDSNGDIYPCFMFYRFNEFNLGSVNSLNSINNDMREKFLSSLIPNSIANLSQSWAKKFLNGCAGGNYFKSGHHGLVSENEIRLVESMVEAAIVELSHMKTDLLNYLPHAIKLFRWYNASVPI